VVSVSQSGDPNHDRLNLVLVIVALDENQLTKEKLSERERKSNQLGWQEYKEN
jgi:hypothetical protein